MSSSVNFYSNKKDEIKSFLCKFYNDKINMNIDLEWKKEFDNPIEIADFIGTFIDNNDKYEITMWVSLDEGFLLNVNDNNADQIIRYLYERYPY